MKLLLDTCCIVWAVSEPSSLSKAAKTLLTADESDIGVSVISAAEIACAAERGRIVIDRHWKKWFRYYIGLNGWQVEDIDLDIMEEAYSLPEAFHADPADRIIVATALYLGADIITMDDRIQKAGLVKCIW